MAARTTKKDLESKIALLEKKLQKLTDSVDLQKTSPKPASVKPKGTLPKGTAPKPTPEYVKPKGTLQKPQHLQNLQPDLHKQNPKALCQTESASTLQRRKTLQQTWHKRLKKHTKRHYYTPAKRFQKKAVTGYTAQH